MEEKQIPKIVFNDNQIVVETTEIPINFNGEDTVIKFKKLTAGEKRDLVKKTAQVKVVGTQPSANVDSIGYMIGLLARVIVEAPFPTTEDVISNLPEEVLTYLSNEYQAFAESKKKD